MNEIENRRRGLMIMANANSGKTVTLSAATNPNALRQLIQSETGYTNFVAYNTDDEELSGVGYVSSVIYITLTGAGKTYTYTTAYMRNSQNAWAAVAGSNTSISVPSGQTFIVYPVTTGG